MLLTVDIGNTNTVFAVYDQDKLYQVWRCTTDSHRTADEYAAWLLQIMHLEHLSQHDIDAIIISSVVPCMTFHIQTLCTRYFHCKPLVIGDPLLDLGIQLLVQYPQEVGSDRLVNTVAAVNRYPKKALIVVDFGTAVTFDVINENQCYIGGVIAPGVNASLTALEKSAALLPYIAIAQPQYVIGKNTVSCMQSGIFWGFIGLVEGLLDRIQSEYHKPMTIIATGGFSTLFSPHLPQITAFEKDLTLYGLYLVYERNKHLFSETKKQHSTSTKSLNSTLP